MHSVVLFVSIAPNTPADQEKLAHALRVLGSDDPDLSVRPGPDASSVVIGATTEAHLERVVDRLAREFNVGARVGRPKIAYKETLTHEAEGSARHVDRTSGEYAHVALRLRPSASGSGYRFSHSMAGEPIPHRFLPAIERGVGDAMAQGVVSGHPMVDLEVEVYDGSYHATDSTEAAFTSAAAMAFLDAARKAGRVVLEPIMQVLVVLQERHLETVKHNLLDRHGEVQEPQKSAEHHVLIARVPLSGLLGFESELKAQTHGQSSCTVWFAGYQPVVRGSGPDDEGVSPVGAPLRPAPTRPGDTTSVPEPGRSDKEGDR